MGLEDDGLIHWNDGSLVGVGGECSDVYDGSWTTTERPKGMSDGGDTGLKSPECQDSPLFTRHLYTTDSPGRDRVHR